MCEGHEFHVYSKGTISCYRFPKQNHRPGTKMLCNLHQMDEAYLKFLLLKQFSVCFLVTPISLSPCNDGEGAMIIQSFYKSRFVYTFSTEINN